MTKLDQAKHYVSKGHSVIPLLPKSKKPAIPSWKQYQKRIATSEELEEWFGKHPEYNIGIVTGKISGIVVVDLDTPEAIEYAEKHLPMNTPTVITGKGRQLYYEHPMDREISNFQNRDNLKGIDLRGDGRYVVAPPSIHPSGKQYQWAEGKSLSEVPMQPFPAEIILDKRTKKPLKHLYAGVEEGSRNVSLTRLVGSWVNDALSLEECVNVGLKWNSTNNPPLPDKEVEQTVRSIFEKHQRELPENILDAIIEKATTEDIPEMLKLLSQIYHNTTRDLYVQKIVDKLDVSKRSLQQDLKKIMHTESGEKEEKIKKEMGACFTGLVDIGIDDLNNVVFLIQQDEELHIVNERCCNNVLYIPPPRDILTFSLPGAKEVIRWYGEDNDQTLFEDILEYFKRFSYLPDEYWSILTCFVFLTYLQYHKDVNYCPIILFFADPERGKSRTGKAIINVAYRGIHLADFREANIFRFSQNLNATLFLDVQDLQKKVCQNQAEDILLCRFEKGAVVSRVLFPEKGAFQDMRHFKIYGPTLIATNSAVHKILDTRCIPITMFFKPGFYEDPTKEKAQTLKERLVAWRARVMNKPLPEIDTVQGLSGRYWDITKPLLQVCMMVQPEKFDELRKTLLDIAQQKLEEKSDSIEAKILSILLRKHPKMRDKYFPEHRVPHSGILDELNEGIMDEKYKFTSQRLGRKMQAMGFKKKLSEGRSVIVVNISDLKTLCLQYGVHFPELEILCVPNRLSPTSTDSPNNIKNQEVTQGVSEVAVNDSHLTSTAPNSLIKKQNMEEVGVGGSLEGEENDYYYRDEELERMKRNVKILMAQSRGIRKVTDTVH